LHRQSVKPSERRAFTWVNRQAGQAVASQAEGLRPRLAQM
jgi:hypothetical protein